MKSELRILVGLLLAVFVVWIMGAGMKFLQVRTSIVNNELRATSTGATDINGNNSTSTPLATTTEPVLTGSLTGRVVLGPTCPVVHNPPEPQCADKPYQTTVVVTVSKTNREVGRQVTDAQGHFQFAFLPGAYDVSAQGGTMLPRCSPATVTLVKASTTDVTLFCDTGIR